MIIYVLVFAVLVLGLYAAYRSLGAPARAIAGDPIQTLAAIRETLTAAVSTMAEPRLPLPEAAHDGRKAAAGATQQLSRIDGQGVRSIRDLLVAAADDCAWAGRLMETEGYPANSGIAAAVAALLDHAGLCLEAARVSPQPQHPSP